MYNNTEPARTAETSIKESTDTETESSVTRHEAQGAEAKRLICDKNLGVLVNEVIRNHDDDSV